MLPAHPKTGLRIGYSHPNQNAANVYTKNPDLCKAWLKFYMSPEAQRNELLVEGNSPALVSTWADEEAVETIGGPDVAAVLKKSQMIAKSAWTYQPKQVESTMTSLINKAMLGEITPKEAVEQGAEEIKELYHIIYDW